MVRRFARPIGANRESEPVRVSAAIASCRHFPEKRATWSRRCRRAPRGSSPPRRFFISQNVRKFLVWAIVVPGKYGQWPTSNRHTASAIGCLTRCVSPVSIEKKRRIAAQRDRNPRDNYPLSRQSIAPLRVKRTSPPAFLFPAGSKDAGFSPASRSRPRAFRGVRGAAAPTNFPRRFPFGEVEGHGAPLASPLASGARSGLSHSVTAAPAAESQPQ